MSSHTYVATPPVLARRPVAVLSVAGAPGAPATRYACVLMPDQISAKAGVREEAVMGRFKDAEAPVAPENFVQNRGFVRFLQDVIARHAARCPSLAAEAARVGNGLVYLLDGRRDPAGEPRPEDILGTVSVADGRVSGYTPAPGYAVFTANGFMFIEEWFHERLVEELLALPVGKITLETVPDETVRT